LGWTCTLQESLLKNVANLGAIQEVNHIMVVHYDGQSLELERAITKIATFGSAHSQRSVVYVYLDLENADAIYVEKENMEDLSLQLGQRMMSRYFFGRPFSEFCSLAYNTPLYANRHLCTFEAVMRYIIQHARDPSHDNSCYASRQCYFSLGDSISGSLSGSPWQVHVHGTEGFATPACKKVGFCITSGFQHGQRCANLNGTFLRGLSSFEQATDIKS